MSRRNPSKNDIVGAIWLIIIGIPIFLFNWITENVGWFWVIIGVAVISVIIVLARKKSQNDRREYLQKKYGDLEIVEKIMQKYMWEGQTEEQLLDSLGQPSAIDNHLLKTRFRQVWKYQPIGRDKYGLRVTLDDKHVVAWNQRN